MIAMKSLAFACCSVTVLGLTIAAYSRPTAIEGDFFYGGDDDSEAVGILHETLRGLEKRGKIEGLLKLGESVRFKGRNAMGTEYVWVLTPSCFSEGRDYVTFTSYFEAKSKANTRDLECLAFINKLNAVYNFSKVSIDADGDLCFEFSMDFRNHFRDEDLLDFLQRAGASMNIMILKETENFQRYFN